MTCNFKFHSMIIICAIPSCSFFSSPSFNSFFRLSTVNSAIMTHSSEQNIVSSNFLIDQTAQPPGDQHQDTNDRLAVPANLLVPHITDRTVDHHQGKILKLFFIQFSIRCRFNFNRRLFSLLGTRMSETIDQPTVAAKSLIPQSAEPEADHHQGIIFKPLFIQVSIGTVITDVNDQPDGPADLVTLPSSQ
ncbi:hypothetical protein Hanom_Chr04g00326771 [Helianthus anomalus]